MIGETIGMLFGDVLYGFIFEGGKKGAAKYLKNAASSIIEKISESLNFAKDFVVGGFSRLVDNLVTVDPIPVKEGWGVRAGLTKGAKMLGLYDWLAEKGFAGGKKGQIDKFPNILNILFPWKFLPILFKSFFPPSGAEDVKVSSPPSGKADLKDDEKKDERKKGEAKKQLEGMKKMVGNVVDSTKGAISGAWNWITGGGGDGDKKGKVIKEALKKKNAAQKGSSKRYSQEEYDKMSADYKANPTSGGAMRLNSYARRLKGQNQAEFGGTGEAFTFGDKTYQPGDEGYLEAINAAKSIILKTANQQGGACLLYTSPSPRDRG